MAASRSRSESAAATAITVPIMTAQSGIIATRVSRLRKILAIEAVPQSPHIHQVARIRWVRFDLAPQVGDMVIHDPFRRKRIASPAAVQQLVAAQHPPRRADEQRKQLELD